MRGLCLAFSWLILTAAALGAAAQKPDPDLLVTLKFLPQESVRSNPVALPASVIDRAVDVRVIDSRESTSPLVVGAGTNDDDLPFAIRATTDVGQFVGDAVMQLTTAQSLKRSASADRVLQLRLTRFNVSESNKAIGSTYSAEVSFAYTLVDSAGKTLAEGAAPGTANRYGRARSGANCAEVLSDALKDAFTKVIGDQVLQQAWTSGQSMPSTTRPGTVPPASTVEERLRTLDDLLKKGVITNEEHATRRAAILKEL